MKKRTLHAMEIASLCQELALLLHAGVSVGDGLTLLAEESPEPLGPMLGAMARQVDGGASLADALRTAEAFPQYVTGLVEMGQQAGRLEEALGALARHYEERERLDRRIRSALLYPSVLLVLMLAVIVVLLSRVLPVFNEVYAALGGRLTGMAGGLLTLGLWLDSVMPVLCGLLAVVVIFLAAFSASGRFREGVLSLWRKHRGDKGVSRKLNDARFAQALSMGLRSGLPMEHALDLAAELLTDVPAFAVRCQACKTRLEQGGALAEALGQADVLPASACRLLALGAKSGSADSVMEEIARRLSEEADMAMEDRAARVEPSLVLASSILVGAILLSVMLPLMHIMTAIG